MKVMLSIALVGGVALAAIAGARWIAATPQNREPEAAPVTTEVVTLQVTGMSCTGCEAAVRGAARQVAGVTDVTASYEHGVAEVTYDPLKTTPEAIAKAITEGSGFTATPTAGSAQ